MSSSANAGELRTAVQFFHITRTVDAEGYPTDVVSNIFGTGAVVRVKWVNAHGREVYEAMQQQLKEPATLTCRYSSLIDPQCLVYKGSDPVPYEILSIDNVQERNQWLEIKVQRRVNAT